MFNKYDVYTETASIYCYKDTNILYNKFGLRDYETLKQIEADITTVKFNSMITKPIKGRFTISHICNIHKFLFEDIYKFAGHFRKETIKKGETTFLNENEIHDKLKRLLNELKKEKFLSGYSKDDFIKRLSFYFAELNYIHPFREGNGRTTREFIRLLCEYNGYRVNWKAVDVNTFLDAMVLSIYDTSKLEETLEKCISIKI